MTIENSRLLSTTRRLPLCITPSESGESIVDLLARDRAELDAMLLDHGAILFRNFDISSSEEFQRFVDAFDAGNLDYRYRSTPRKSCGRGIYTATEYPAAREIPLHNENSYQHDWPGKLAFACMVPAGSGGATSLADMREVRHELDPAVFDAFRRCGVRYDRVFHPHVDLPWEEVFQTHDRCEVEQFCDTNDIGFEWIEDDVLRTWQVSQGVIRHPILGEEFLFNQAHLFHPSALGEETLAQMIDVFGEVGLPRNAHYGDGRSFEPDTLTEIRRAYDAASFDLDWVKGDVVLIDNLQVAHGRRPFEGNRLVLAALLDPQHARSSRAATS